MTKLSALDALRLQYLRQHGGIPSDSPMRLPNDENDHALMTSSSDQRPTHQSCGEERFGDAPD